MIVALLFSHYNIMHSLCALSKHAFGEIECNARLSGQGITLASGIESEQALSANVIPIAAYKSRLHGGISVFADTWRERSNEIT